MEEGLYLTPLRIVTRLAGLVAALAFVASAPSSSHADGATPSDPHLAEMIDRLKRDQDTVTKLMTQSCSNVSFCLSHLAEGVNTLGSDLSAILPQAIQQINESPAIDARRISQVIATEQDPKKLEAYAAAVEKAIQQYAEMFTACGTYSLTDHPLAAHVVPLIHDAITKSQKIQDQISVESARGIYRGWANGGAGDKSSVFNDSHVALVLDQMGVPSTPPQTLAQSHDFQGSDDLSRLAQAAQIRFPDLPLAQAQALTRDALKGGADNDSVLHWIQALHREAWLAKAGALSKSYFDPAEFMTAYDQCVKTYKTFTNSAGSGLLGSLDKCENLAETSLLLKKNEILIQADIEKTARFKKTEFDAFSKTAFENTRSQLVCEARRPLILLTQPDPAAFSSLKALTDDQIVKATGICKDAFAAKVFEKVVDSIVATVSDHYIKTMVANPKLKSSIDRNPKEFASFVANLNDGNLEPCLKKEIQTKRASWDEKVCTTPLNRALLSWAMNSDARYAVNHDPVILQHQADIKAKAGMKSDKIDAFFAITKAHALESYEQCLAGMDEAALERFDTTRCAPTLSAAIDKIRAVGFNASDPVFALANDFLAWSAETERDVYLYNYRKREFLVNHGFPASGPVPLKHPAAVAYAKEWASAYWAFRGAGSQDDGGMVGWGLYTAEDPSVSQSYGDVLLKIRVPKGSRFLDLRDGGSGSSIEVSRQTYNQISAMCGWQSNASGQQFGPTEYIQVSKASFTQTASCHALLTAASQLAGINFLAYTWQGSASSLCPQPAHSSAFVLIDTPLDDANIDVLVPDYTPGDPSKDKVYHLVNSYYESVAGAAKWSNVSGSATPEEKDWVRQTVMECGTYPKDRAVTPH